MSEAKFTKGPWIVDGYGNIIPENGKDARDCIRAGGLALTANEGEPMYNRHLIACAPEMYAMLEEILGIYSSELDYDAIKSLLAKARGEK